MRDEPPSELAALLLRLHLATPQQVATAGRFARRMAGDLPLFDSVWIDALVQSRLLTPYQAAEINSGRGERLLVGQYVIRHALADLGYARSFAAIELRNVQDESKHQAGRHVNLVVKSCRSDQSAAGAAAKLQSLLGAFSDCKPIGIAPLVAAGANGQMLWAAFENADGFPIAQSIACSGRLPPAAVLEIARQLVVSLGELQQAGFVHGDISASSLWLASRGQIKLALCGIRSAMEPLADNTNENVVLETFDYLAPERLSLNSSPTTSSDMYACGCLWWHLLAGRPPLLGGDAMGKTQAVLQPRIANIRHIAPDVPECLASAIEACTQVEPTLRPTSFSELAVQLGSTGRAGHRQLAARLAASGHRVRCTSGWKTQLRWQHAGQPILAIAACLFLLAAATWPLWRSRHSVNRQAGATTIARAEGSPNARPPNSEPRQESPRVATATDSQRDVRQVNYQSVDDRPPAPTKIVPTAKENSVVELACDTEINGATLRLQSGTTVRGIGKKRPQIITPPNGIIVAVDQVRFENVDFIWRPRAEEIISPERHALIDIRAGYSEFSGCTFQAVASGNFELPAAIRLSDNRIQRGASLAPAARVRLEHSAVQGVACAIDCRLKGPAAINMLDVLHLGRGALIEFSLGRPADAPTAINLEHVTVRGVPAVLHFDDSEATDHAGAITLTATACVFAPDETGSLICFSGGRLLSMIANNLRSLEWVGQGSLMPPDMAVAIWQHASKKEPVPETDLALEGLVTAGFDFVGPATSQAATSRLRRWLAPQKTDEAPGIRDSVPCFPPAAGRRD